MSKLIPMVPLVIFWGGVAFVFIKYPNVARWIINPAPWVSKMQDYVLVMFFVFALGIYILAQH